MQVAFLYVCILCFEGAEVFGVEKGFVVFMSHTFIF